jgi:hypothetical protein
MAAVPPLSPVTNPVLLTVATTVLEDIHGFEAAAVPEPVNWVVEFAQIVVVPVMEGTVQERRAIKTEPLLIELLRVPVPVPVAPAVDLQLG